jgi:hypothetical protein
MRDGVSVNKNRITKPLVLPSELLSLPFGEGYFCMGGKFPIAKVNFTYEQFPSNNKALEFAALEEAEEVKGNNEEDIHDEKTNFEEEQFESSEEKSFLSKMVQ